MATLQEIRARLLAQDKKFTGGSFDTITYPHWNITENSSCRVRFTPDGNSKNDFFWVERLLIKLQFNGTKGSSDNKPVFVQVPCVEMWGEACPILAEIKPMWKDDSLKEIASKYWKKKSYLMQGFVRENPIAEDASKERENPIRKFIIGPQIFTLIKAALMDSELEDLPTDYQHGLDFIITKTAKGSYSDYNSSKWTRKESALTQVELAAIEKFGLNDLSTFLPKKPTEVEMKIIKEMFEASIDGQPYDSARWSQHFRPTGFDSTPVVPASVEPEHIATAEVAASPTVTPVAASNDKPSSARAADIIAQLRNRGK